MVSVVEAVAEYSNLEGHIARDLLELFLGFLVGYEM